MPLRAAGLGRLARKLRRRVRLFLRGESPRHFFDLDDRERVDAILTAHGLPPLPGSPREVALRDGDAERGESVYELRPDVREAIPLALTPAHRGAFLRWFAEYGRHEVDAGVADVLRYLFEQDGRPDRGLDATYRVQPTWQSAHPGALTPAGWGPFKRWVADRYAVTGRWLREAEGESGRHGEGETGQSDGSGSFSPSPTLPLSPSALVIGLFRYTSGLKEAATAMVEALASAGVALSLRDVPRPIGRDGRRRAGFDGLERYPVTILNTGLDLGAEEAYRLAGLYRRGGVYRVAVWWWELSAVPTAWADRGRDVDEIWAPTAFVADALRPLGRPVHHVPLSVELPAFGRRPKGAFGLDPGRFAFLFAFDMNSRLPRKNPLGLIRAFRTAFKPSEPVDLVIKVNPQDRDHAEWWRELRTAAAGAGVKLIDRAMSREELLGLMDVCDAYVSLHRSEGFGLTMAEAMLLGKPTAATGYSGNLDFMTTDNSYLIDYSLVPVEDPAAPPGAVWAEPSVAHAAEVLRSIVDDPATAAEKGRRARAELREKLSHQVAGERMAARLRAILSGTGGGPE
jgi:glycosyltransferase involved in cell wall biosynthesis